MAPCPHPPTAAPRAAQRRANAGGGGPREGADVAIVGIIGRRNQGVFVAPPLLRSANAGDGSDVSQSYVVDPADR